MSLDLFSRNIDDAVNYAARASAPELPSTFSDNFNDAWNRGFLTAQSVSGSNRLIEARRQLVDDAVAKTGDQSLGSYISPDGRDSDFEAFNRRLDEHRIANPSVDVPMLSEEAIQARADDIGRQQLSDSANLSRRERTTGGAIGEFAGSTAATFTDPVNLVAFPLAAPESLGVLGTAMAWAAIGAGSQGVIEALNIADRERIQPGYAASGEQLRNILEAGAGAAVLGGGLKGLSNLWTRYKTGSWPRTIRDAGNVVDSEAQIANTNPLPGVEGEAAHRTALQKAIDDMIAGRPVDVAGIVPGDVLRGYEAKTAPIMESRARAAGAEEAALAFERDAARLPPTMERLSEVQLDEFRVSALEARQSAEVARSRLEAERAGLIGERNALEQRTAGLAGHEANVAGVRNDLARVEQRIAEARPPIDETTQARLDAIDAELKGQVGQEVRTRLEAERAQITETLAKTAPEDRRLIASLEAERKGLEKALVRAEKQLEKERTAVAKIGERLTAREAALPTRGITVGEREAAKVEAATGALRKAISRLANDGYGVRLTREEAQTLAERIIGASPQDAEGVLRDITEGLVSRAVDARRALPAELPGIGKPVPAAEQRARAGYYTEQMRKQITALAREVGYEMPREEAATIAARIAGLSENDALAVLDELMLRPRTIVDTLPGVSREDVAKPIRAAPDSVTALHEELQPAKIEEMRTNPDLADTVSRDLDKLMLEQPDLEVPTGTTIDADGRVVPTTRKVESVVAEADSRLAAAKEIADCVGPYPAQAAE